MKPQRAPPLESRRAAEFERELITRARTWLPSWSLDEGQADFGLALLKIAARFNSEVAERLDVAGEKMALGFLDWLGVQGAAARPARLPVVLKMTDSAREPVLAQQPVKLQVDVPGAETVTFETESDLQVIPGQMAAIVAADPAKDAYYLPPPGLSSLAPADQLPTAWKLKNFAAPKSKTLQLDPGLGLVPDMLIEIAGNQYKIVKAKDDLVTIDPEVPPGDGFAEGTPVTKVETFRPFDGARNLQEHILYIGDPDVLNVEAEARIEVVGLQAPKEAAWEYWGKSEPEDPLDADPRWRGLEPEQIQAGAGPAPLILKKPKGSVETTAVGPATGRWIRAKIDNSSQPVTTDGVKLRINPREDDKVPAELRPPVKWDKALRPDIFVNSTPSPPSNFYPLGRQPRLFDTLYVGSEDAFSKQGATAWIQFDLSDAVFQSISAINAPNIGLVLAAIDLRGALHLLTMAAGTISRLQGREPMRPGDDDLLPEIHPVMWMEGTNLHVAVASANSVQVWKEVRPAAEQSGWEDHGSPLGGPAQGAKIAGLARVDWGGSKLVAARGGNLSKKAASTSGDPWVSHPTTFTAARIFPVQTQPAGGTPTRLIALKAATPYELIDLTSASEVALFDTVDPTIQPAALEIDSAGLKTLQLIAADENRNKLRVWDGNNADVSPLFRGTLEIMPGSQIAGRFEDGNLSGYAIAAEDPTSAQQVLLSWQPKNAKLKDIFFEQEIILGKVRGAISIISTPGEPDIALVPGINRGELFGVTLGGKRATFSIDGDALTSALAIRSPDTLNVDDVVVYTDGTDLFGSKVEISAGSGLPEYSTLQFYWLEDWLDRSTDETDIYVFRPGAAAEQGAVTRIADDELEFPAGVASVPKCIGVEDANGDVTVFVTSNFSATTHRANVEPQLPAAINGPFWFPKTVRGQFFPAIDLSGATGDAWTVEALQFGRLYCSKLDPNPLRAIAPATGAGLQPSRLAFSSQWSVPPPLPAGGTSVEFAVDGAVTVWASLFGETDANPALSWEYWDGSGWSHLPIKQGDDATNHLRNSGTVEFDVPHDLQATEWAGKSNYWVRARLIGGDYGEEKVVVTTQDKGGGKTEQTIDRIPEGVQPPYALEVGVAYALDKPVIPAFLLTQDSGAVRDQSDANRSPGAMVEIFTPLAVTLGRFDAPAATASSTAECIPDCECKEGTASTSPTPPSVQADTAETAPEPSTGGRRAIFLGFTSKLIGQPVNVLFLAAREGSYDAISPLKIDALIGDRFSSIIAEDETRSLGETGLLKMTFEVEPKKADLFGQALAWLRIAPSVDSADWLPAIGGIYPNGVWAQSAETMTRELLGSSGGQPRLAVALARPPLLEGSLELRVREPLGEEELKALTDQDPDLVKNGIADLPGDWVLWKEVADPTDCGPRDRVYALDEATGAVRFGDGLHGMIPPVGVDSIVAFTYRRMEAAVGSEVAANKVKAGDELNLVTPVESVESVVAADRSAGGVAPESSQRVLQFAPATLRHRGRAVSAKDFEDLVRQKSADVVQARCFVRNGRLRLVVVMRGSDPAPSNAQQRELRRMLLECGPASLAARGALTIVGPRVRKLRVQLVLGVATLDDAGDVAKDAKDRLVNRFSTEFGGDTGEGWPLGREPEEGDVAEAVLDVPKLESILSIALLELDHAGAERPWPGAVKSSELVMLAAEDVRVGFDILEAVA